MDPLGYESGEASDIDVRISITFSIAALLQAILLQAKDANRNWLTTKRPKLAGSGRKGQSKVTTPSYQERSEDPRETTRTQQRSPPTGSLHREDGNGVDENFARLTDAAEPFPMRVLPDPARQLVTDASSAFSCPPDYVAIPVLVALGAANGCNRKLSVKEGWIECSSMYGVIVGLPGTTKSPAIDVAVSYPRVDYGGSVKFQTNAAIIVTDTTIEALGLELREAQGSAVLCKYDELSALPASFNRYRKGLGSDRQTYQSLWGGQALSISRTTLNAGKRERDQIYVRDPFVSIVGGTQPDYLVDLWDHKGRADGFVDRFLFAFPQPIRRVYRTPGIGSATFDAYWSLIYTLQSCGINPNEKPIITFLSDARRLWDEYSSEHFAQEEHMPPYMIGSWSKLHAYAARFALTLQIAYRAAGETESEDIEVRAVENAIRLVRYFASHAGKVHRHVRRNHEDARLNELLRWIAGRNDGTATVRDVVTSKVAGFRTAEDTLTAFARLASMGTGKVVKSDPRQGGRPSFSFQCFSGDC